MTRRRANNHRVLISLGSNVGRRASNLARALELLSGDIATSVVRRSRIYVTHPVGDIGGRQLPYFNAAALLATRRDPHSLLALFMQIERLLQRRRTVHWGSRTVDLDLLIYDDRIMQSKCLTIPHPRMTWRRFVLMPAAEINRALIHPIERQTIEHLLARICDRPMSVVVAGPSNSDIMAIARRLADATDGRVGEISFDKWAGMLAPEAIQFDGISGVIIKYEQAASATDTQDSLPRLLGWVGPAVIGQTIARSFDCPCVQLVDANDAQNFIEFAAAVDGVRDIDANGRPMVKLL